MFKKLRNKFLLLNMIIITVVMLVAFAGIFFINYSNIKKDNHDKLDTLSATVPPGIPPDPGMIYSYNFINSFILTVDESGNLLSVQSFSATKFTQQQYTQAVNSAISSPEDYSVMTMAGRKWQYIISPSEIISYNNNGEVYTSVTYKISFIDVTESYKTLTRLLATFIIVGTVMLAVIFLISLFFAGKAIKPISEAFDKQKQFVADASHELKTPLAIINANYDAILSNGDETVNSQKKWFEYIRIGTDRMSKLINDLLSLARIEDSNAQMMNVPFNISKEIVNTITSLQSSISDKGITLTQNIQQDIIIESDYEKINQVFMILLDNALKYTPTNGFIEVSLTKSKKVCTCTVKNSGKGIPSKDLPKVFDRFYRVDAARTQEISGYGLGLSIAKTIIDRLNGSINVSSVENDYTSFTFTINLS